ncbi:MAG TPA: hypothetical protein VGP47_03410, partial [Parachlamydiaceae bacterium]|nr:hypothetical protein [Parachlamydiaceae bacterium]
ADPNVLNDDGDSPVSLALSLCLQNPEKSNFRVELPAAIVSDATFASAIAPLFKNNVHDVDLDILFGGVERIVSRLKTNGNEKLLEKYFKPEVRDILKHLIAENRLKFCSWLEKIGVEYTVDTLSYLLTSTCNLHNYKTQFQPFIVRLFSEMDIPLDEELETGEHLLHTILSEPNLSLSDKSEFVQLILKKFPQEIDTRDKTGKRLLSILFVKSLDSLYGDLIGYISEEDVKKQREECHSIIKSDLALNQIDGRIKNLTAGGYKNYIQKMVDYFLYIKKLFSSHDSFDKWLLEFAEESFIHEIAFWHPMLIEYMLEAKLISAEMCELENNVGLTVYDICETQNKLFTAFKNPAIGTAIDPDAYANYNEKVRKLGEKPFIFDLLESANQSRSLQSKLLKQLILLDPNITDSEGNTLLHAFLNSNFCTLNKKQILLYLLDHGVDPKQLNDAGKSPLDIARKFNRTFAYPYLR